jgi:hypothetical protein
MPPIFRQRSLIIPREVATIRSPAPVRIMLFGMRCIAPAIMIRLAPTLPRPLPRVDRFIPPNLPTALAMICNAAATAIRLALLIAIFLGMSCIVPAIAARPPATPTRPLAN